MPDGADGPDPAPLDELDLEIRELTEGRAGDPLFLEPSAAERGKAAPVRTEDVPGVRDASGSPTAPTAPISPAAPRAPDASDAPSAPSAPGGTRAVRRRTWRGARLAAALLAVALLLVGGGLVWLRFGHTAGGSDRSAPVPDTALGSILGTIAPGDLFAGASADPFLGTPANEWADGAAGIVAPPAEAVGGFTPAQVAAAYATTGELVAAASLDRQTLLGGQPAALERLLTARQRAMFTAGLAARGLGKDGRPLSTRSWVASFAPGTAQLDGGVIKVSGTMDAVVVTESGRQVLRVEVNYSFVYAVEPPHDTTDWSRVVTRQYGSVDFARWDDPHGALEPWDKTVVDPLSGVACGPADGYIHPAYPSNGSISAQQSKLVIRPYSRALPAASGACASTRGS
jgi:hypothetical protein